MAPVELNVPPSPAYVGVIRLALSALGRVARLDDDRVEELKIAASEACANAVLATQDAGRDDPVTVTWREEDDCVVVEVADRGNGGRDDERMALSTALLQSLVDECDSSLRNDGTGMRTRLLVRK